MQSLKRIITANSVFSEVSGLILLVGAGLLDEMFGLDAWLLALVGLSLIGYGVLLWLLAGRDDVRPGAKLATVLDVNWVITAAVILIGFPRAMTSAGRLALLTVSVVVAGFAGEQVIGLRRSGEVEPISAATVRA